MLYKLICFFQSHIHYNYSIHSKDADKVNKSKKYALQNGPNI
jgi:hypothetical protein